MRLLILCSTIILAGATCFAGTAKELLAEMAQTMAGFKDYKVTVTGEQWVKGPRGKQKTKSSARMRGLDEQDGLDQGQS